MPNTKFIKRTIYSLAFSIFCAFLILFTQPIYAESNSKMDINYPISTEYYVNVPNAYFFATLNSNTDMSQNSGKNDIFIYLAENNKLQLGYQNKKFNIFEDELLKDSILPIKVKNNYALIHKRTESENKTFLFKVPNKNDLLNHNNIADMTSSKLIELKDSNDINKLREIDLYDFNIEAEFATIIIYRDFEIITYTVNLNSDVYNADIDNSSKKKVLFPSSETTIKEKITSLALNSTYATFSTKTSNKKLVALNIANFIAHSNEQQTFIQKPSAENIDYVLTMDDTYLTYITNGKLFTKIIDISNFSIDLNNNSSSSSIDTIAINGNPVANIAYKSIIISDSNKAYKFNLDNNTFKYDNYYGIEGSSADNNKLLKPYAMEIVTNGNFNYVYILDEHNRLIYYKLDLSNNYELIIPDNNIIYKDANAKIKSLCASKIYDNINEKFVNLVIIVDSANKIKYSLNHSDFIEVSIATGDIKAIELLYNKQNKSDKEIHFINQNETNNKVQNTLLIYDNSIEGNLKLVDIAFSDNGKDLNLSENSTIRKSTIDNTIKCITISNGTILYGLTSNKIIAYNLISFNKLDLKFQADALNNILSKTPKSILSDELGNIYVSTNNDSATADVIYTLKQIDINKYALDDLIINSDEQIHPYENISDICIDASSNLFILNSDLNIFTKVYLEKNLASTAIFKDFKELDATKYNVYKANENYILFLSPDDFATARVIDISWKSNGTEEKYLMLIGECIDKPEYKFIVTSNMKFGYIKLNEKFTLLKNDKSQVFTNGEGAQLLTDIAIYKYPFILNNFMRLDNERKNSTYKELYEKHKNIFDHKTPTIKKLKNAKLKVRPIAYDKINGAVTDIWQNPNMPFYIITYYDEDLKQETSSFVLLEDIYPTDEATSKTEKLYTVNAHQAGRIIYLYAEDDVNSEILWKFGDNAKVYLDDINNKFDPNSTFTKVYIRERNNSNRVIKGYIETKYLSHGGLTKLQKVAISVTTIFIVITAGVLLSIQLRKKHFRDYELEN